MVFRHAHEVIDDVEVVVDHVAAGMDVLAFDQGGAASLITCLDSRLMWVMQSTPTGRLLRPPNQMPLRHHHIRSSCIISIFLLLLLLLLWLDK